MKIGIDGRAAKWYRGTGIGTYTYQLINNLSIVDSSNQYLILLPQNTDLVLKDNFTIECLKESSNNHFWDDVKTPNILKNNKMDLYHVPQNGVGLSKNINCLKAITLHDIIPLKLPETVSDRYLKIFNEELPKIIPDCDGIITVSDFSKEDIAKEFNFPKEKIYVTHLAAEEIYRPLSKNSCKKIIKEKYGISENLKVVITGRKGISYDRYKLRTEELNISSSVIFTDFIPLEDLPIFYNACELLTYPSFYEGFGLPPLEAMACGTPVITSNITSLPELFYNSALLVNPYDVYALSYAMEKVLCDSLLKLTMVQKGLITSSNYTWQKTAKNTISAYEKIINSK